MNARIITIGDEILIGQVIDTNSAWMAQQLNLKGIAIQDILSISDSEEAITNAIEESLKAVDLILITGGLGPTKDDITKKTLAKVFGVEMVFDTGTYERIERLFERWGRSMTPANREMCYMPANAQILRNKKGTAPGMWFEINKKIVVSMPGVPYEMKYLMSNEVIPRLEKEFVGIPIEHRTVLTVGEGESRLASRIEDFETNLPSNIKLAFLPGLGQVRLRLTARGEDREGLKQLLGEKVKELQSLVPEFIFGYEKQTLEEVVGQLLKDKKKTIATAESCTGGYLAHRITSVPGSSAYYTGSVVAYSYDLKERLLDVDPEVLKKHGAVCEEVVLQMARGTLKNLETDIAIAISGIAGPDGGTPEKPVGTIWLAIADNEKERTLKLQLGKDRIKNIEYTSVQALNMIRKFLLAE